MAESIRVEIKAEITDKELLGKALRRFLEDALRLASEELSEPGVVPIDTTRLRDSLAPGANSIWQIDQADIPTSATMGTDLRYGSILEESDRFHYRAGPSQGKPTQGWFSTGVQHTAASLDGLLDQLVDDIQGEWKKVAK